MGGAVSMGGRALMLRQILWHFEDWDVTSLSSNDDKNSLPAKLLHVIIGRENVLAEAEWMMYGESAYPRAPQGRWAADTNVHDDQYDKKTYDDNDVDHDDDDDDDDDHGDHDHDEPQWHIRGNNRIATSESKAFDFLWWWW